MKACMFECCKKWPFFLSLRFFRRKKGEIMKRQVSDARHGHVLTLMHANNRACDGCKKSIVGETFQCSLCGFDLHPACVAARQHLRWKDAGHEHELVYTTSLFGHVCDVCGGGMSEGYKCSKWCRLLGPFVAHPTCLKSPPTPQTDGGSANQSEVLASPALAPTIASAKPSARALAVFSSMTSTDAEPYSAKAKEFFDAGECVDALLFYKKAYEITLRKGQTTLSRLLKSIPRVCAYGEVLSICERHVEAIPILRKGIDGLSSCGLSESSDFADLTARLGYSLFMTNALEEAFTQLQKAISLWEKHQNTNKFQFGRAMYFMSLVQFKRSKSVADVSFDSGMQSLLRSVQIMALHQSEDKFGVLMAASLLLGRIGIQCQKYDLAIKGFEKCVRVSSEACFELGCIYRDGLSVGVDWQRACKFFESGVKLPEGFCCAGPLAFMLLKGGPGIAANYNRAAEVAQSGASNGDSLSQAVLGVLYRDGKGVQVDLAKSLQLIDSSVAKGSSFGHLCLGEMYLNGFGVPRNVSRAKELLSYAAETGSMEARELLQELGKEVVEAEVSAVACVESCSTTVQSHVEIRHDEVGAVAFVESHSATMQPQVELSHYESVPESSPPESFGALAPAFSLVIDSSNGPSSDVNLLSTFSSSQPYSVDQSLINRDMKRLSFAAASVDISDYRLGKGSMCSIFRGMVELDDAELEQVAVKVLKGQGDELMTAIAAEIALLGRPGLRGLMRLKGVVEEKGWLVLDVMEGSLREWMKARPCLAPEYVVQCATTIVEGMKMLKQSECTLGILSTESVLVDETGRVFLCDFSVECVGNSAWPFSEAFLAPESLRNCLKNSSQKMTREGKEKADVWSFGVLIWEMVHWGGNDDYKSAEDGYKEQLLVGQEVDDEKFCKCLLEEIGIRGKRLDFGDVREEWFRLVDDVKTWCWSLEAKKRITWTQMQIASASW